VISADPETSLEMSTNATTYHPLTIFLKKPPPNWEKGVDNTVDKI